MSSRNLEKITQDYWNVSHALRSPNGQPLGCGKALDALRSADKLRPTDWKLSELMHVINFDIIEGGTKWREEHKAVSSASIHPMKD